MCGVLGIYGKNASAVSVTCINAALKKISHRGPDFQNYVSFLEYNCVLGHTRLSILDLSTNANQPMRGESGAIAYNGEIYNHLELRKDLPEVWSTSSDTETLLVGLGDTGVDFINYLDGMFSAAYINFENGELTLFRDTLGIKNLYYFVHDETVYFCSEVKGLSEIIPLELEVSYDVVKDYLEFENFHQGITPFKDIYSLRPGEVMRFSFDKVLHLSTDIIKYPKYALQKISDSDILSTIEKSVKSHLLSDVPVGVYMSGGIDSSIVAILAAKYNKSIEGYTGFFKSENLYYDERVYTRLTAEKAKIKLYEIEITPSHFIKHFDEVVYCLDYPRMGMGSFSQFIVAREARKKNKVMLAGHGGDELFGGYPMFKAFWLNKLIAGIQFRKIVRFLFRLNKKEFIWVLYFFYQKIVKRKVYFAPQIFNINREKQESVFFSDKLSSKLQDLFNYYLGTYIPGLLDVEDKISMFNSLETRVPLWSRGVVEVSSQIPIEIKLKNGQLKGKLKDVFKDILPREILNAPKKGFPTPLREWFRGELKEFVQSRLLVENDFLDQFITLKERRKIIESHIKKPLPFSFDEKRSHKIWMLLCLESWGRQYKL